MDAIANDEPRSFADVAGDANEPSTANDGLEAFDDMVSNLLTTSVWNAESNDLESRPKPIKPPQVSRSQRPGQSVLRKTSDKPAIIASKHASRDDRASQDDRIQEDQGASSPISERRICIPAKYVPDWTNAAFHAEPADLVQALSARLKLAVTTQERAAIREEVATIYLQHREDSANLSVLLCLVFDYHHPDEFKAQAETSSACLQLRNFADQLLSVQKVKKSQDDMATACHGTVKRWGPEFFHFAVRHKWFNKTQSPNKKFWREARAASTRVPLWKDAKSRLNLILLRTHLRDKDWPVVLHENYLNLTKTAHLKAIDSSAEPLDDETIYRYRLVPDCNEEIDFRNYKQIIEATSATQPSFTTSQTETQSLFKAPSMTVKTPALSTERIRHTMDALSKQASSATVATKPQASVLSKSANHSTSIESRTSNPALFTSAVSAPLQSSTPPAARLGKRRLQQPTKLNDVSGTLNTARQSLNKRRKTGDAAVVSGVTEAGKAVVGDSHVEMRDDGDVEQEGEEGWASKERGSSLQLYRSFKDEAGRYRNAQKIASDKLADAHKAIAKALESTRNPMLLENAGFGFALRLLDRDKIPLATEWTPSMRSVTEGASGNKDYSLLADTWRLTMVESINLMRDPNTILHKPIIIRANEAEAKVAEACSESFLDQLELIHGGETKMSVQGGTKAEPHLPAHVLTIEEVVRRLREPSHPGVPPLNCLDIQALPSFRNEPAFLTNVRFSLSDMLATRRTRQGATPLSSHPTNPAKQTWSQDLETGERRPMDIENSQHFQLLSSQYTVSRFHKDALNCTWVQCLTGVKAWFFVLPEHEKAWREKQKRAVGIDDDDQDDDADDIDPEHVRVVILGPGDTFFMPAGVPIAHAVITLEGPCIMTGGQRLDSFRLGEQLRQVQSIIDIPQTTNESVPAQQLPSLLNDIQALIRDLPPKIIEKMNLPSAGEIQDIETSMRKTGACDCRVKGEVCDLADHCRCRAKGRVCTEWCHELFDKRSLEFPACISE